MLTIPDQYAGQQMRCPLCQGMFSVPALPSTPAPVVTPPPTPPPPPPPLTPAPPQEDIYALKNDVPTPKPAPAPEPSPSKKSPASKHEPDFDLPPAPPAPPGDYTRAFAVWISPRVLQWIAPAALLFVFILTFFSWVGDYPGGFPVTTQSAWGAGFGGWTSDGNVAQLSPPVEVGGEAVPFVNARDRKPGASVLTIFYLLLLIPTLLVVIASVVLPFTEERLPRQVRDLMPWRQALALVLTLLTFLPFLGQLVAGYAIESKAREVANKKIDAARAGEREPSTKELLDEAVFLDRFRWTNWLRAAFLLHLLAVVCLALEFWIVTRRGRPLPRAQLQW